MLRLIIASVVAYFLIPAELRPDFSGADIETVTSGEAMDAAGSVIRDLGDFCERNPDTCDTGKTLINNAKETMSAGIEKLAEEQGVANNTPESDANVETLEKTD